MKTKIKEWEFIDKDSEVKVVYLQDMVNVTYTFKIVENGVMLIKEQQ
jgi:hypothetical protein